MELLQKHEHAKRVLRDALNRSQFGTPIRGNSTGPGEAQVRVEFLEKEMRKLGIKFIPFWT